MKKTTLSVWCAGLLLLVSCKGEAPNDRAMFNLQGNVKSFVETDQATGNSFRVAFDEQGIMEAEQDNSPLSGYAVLRSYGQLEVVYEETGSSDSYTFTFDKKGRLAGYVHTDSFKVPPVTETKTYEYDKGERLPHAQKSETVSEGSDPQSDETQITYETDSQGNWTRCTSGDETHTRTIEYYDSTAVDNCPMGKSIDWAMIGRILLTLLFLAIFLAILAHMIYENYFRHPLPTDLTADTFARQRSAAGEAPQASEAENHQAMQHLDNLFAAWTVIDHDEDGTEIRTPLSRKVVKLSYSALEAAKACKPTDPDTVQRMNEISDVLNHVEKRTFAGSKRFLVISIIVAVALALISGTYNFLWSIGIGCVLYWFASREPVFMQIRREVNGRGNKPKFMSALIGGLFGAVATATTYKTVTKWSDGTTTTDVDNSETWIMLAIALVVMVVLAVFMWAVALINYLRNYILYR